MYRTIYRFKQVHGQTWKLEGAKDKQINKKVLSNWDEVCADEDGIDLRRSMIFVRCDAFMTP